MVRYLFLFIFAFLTGCVPKHRFEPQVTYFPKQRTIHSLPSAFPSLSPAECKEDWGKELMIGMAFAKDFDLYRAITCFKRSTILLPRFHQERRLQLEYALAYSYFLGKRYGDVLETFEGGFLREISETFPACRDLAIMLYDSYEETDQRERACSVLGSIDQIDHEAAQNLTLYSAVKAGDLALTSELIHSNPQCQTLLPYLNAYNCGKKSVIKARFLNAILPGAGYYYVGQTKSAFTSFVMNALFIAATVQFANKGLVAPALITGSLELGWYVGGINGAGLAAKEYNERLYECQMKDMMIHHRLFPILMLRTAF